MLARRKIRYLTSAGIVAMMVPGQEMRVEMSGREVLVYCVTSLAIYGNVMCKRSVYGNVILDFKFSFKYK